MKNRIVMIIPYFGKIPDYFELWLKSALKNPEFDFLIYSDFTYDLHNYPNIRQKVISFEGFRQKFNDKLQCKVCLKQPYKLCDFRPSYGYILSDDIKGYDFWGFMDVDLILGKLSDFITDEMLNSYDKLFLKVILVCFVIMS